MQLYTADPMEISSSRPIMDLSDVADVVSEQEFTDHADISTTANFQCLWRHSGRVHIKFKKRPHSLWV